MPEPLRETARELEATSALICDSSLAETVTSPLALNVDAVVTVASTSVATLFNARTAPTATVVEAPAGVALIDVLLLAIRASILASESAVIVILSAELIGVFKVHALVVDADLVPRVLPTMASTVLNRKFCASQPTVLNARVIPTPTPFDSIVDFINASIFDSLFASMITSPVPVVVSELLVAYASAADFTRFVATTPPTAMDVPLPVMLPPLADTLLMSTALIVADSSARIVRSPPALAVTFSRYASTSLRTSLRTTSIPNAEALDSEGFSCSPGIRSVGDMLETFVHFDVTV